MKIGITGHQQLTDLDAWVWVEKAISRELKAIQPPLIGITSLAIGADQLFAKLVLGHGGSIHAIIPFAGLERTFSNEDIQLYRELLELASVEVLTTPGTDEDAFLAAGKRVVELSERMIAVWDGKPAKGKGGTGDIAVYTTALGVPLIHIDPIKRTVTRSFQ